MPSPCCRAWEINFHGWEARYFCAVNIIHEGKCYPPLQGGAVLLLNLSEPWPLDRDKDQGQVFFILLRTVYERVNDAICARGGS
jgi:hypothetical protein